MKTISRRKFVETAALALTCALLCADTMRGAEVKVVTSGAFTAAYLELVPEYERTTHVKLMTEFGPSMGTTHNAIPVRLERGEAIDVVIMAAPALADLIKQGKVRADSRIDLVESNIGMAVRAGAPKPDISTVDALKRTLLAAKSIAYSDSASGVYLSTELFPRLGIADQIKGKTRKIEADPVGGVVATGEFEIGFQQISELRPVKGIDIVGPLPTGAQRVTVFAAGIPATSTHPEAAKALIHWLASPAAYIAIKKSGLEPAKSKKIAGAIANGMVLRGDLAAPGACASDMITCKHRTSGGFMRTQMRLGIIPLLIWIAGAADAPITSNPIPEPIVKRGLAVEVKDLVRLPDTRGLRPADQDIAPTAWARVSYVRDLPDGRRFANDSRGFLYLIDAGTTGSNPQPHVYADVSAAFPRSFYNRLESGFIGFVFHPEFATNGLFYTVHSEIGAGNPKIPDFIPIGYGLKDVTYHNVITEWHATNPAANTFEGSRRELLREAHVVANLTHPMGAVEFNPTAKRGDPDYGLLYTSGSDHGFSNGGGPNASNPAQTQRLDSIITAILRIDPRSPSVSHGQKGLGDYTIPMANKFAADGDPKTLGEIYAYGFRNAHRLSWDTDGTMFASDIGMDNIEEINIVRNGENYGWMKREGYFENGRARGGGLNELYPLPPEILDGRVKDGFTYPVVVYDHDEGHSVTDGFAYHGRISALNGKFVFGDIQNGRVFASDLAAMKKADDGIPRTVAPVEEIQLYVRDASGKRVDVSFRDLIDKTMGIKGVARADLHISRSRDGELFLTSRQDGMIRMLVPDQGGPGTGSAKR